MRRPAVVVGAVVLAAAIGVSVLAAVMTSGSSPRLPAVTTSTSTSTTPTAPPQPTWRVAWGSTMAWGYGLAADTTVRDLATVAVGGSAIKVRISNAFGNAPLAVGAATVAVSAGGAAIVPGTLQALAFGGSPTVTVPQGQVVYSDPAPLAVTPLQTLAISIFVTTPELVTVHPCCSQTESFFAPNNAGNLVTSPDGAGLRTASPWGRWADAVDVLQEGGTGSIVVVGDSITDGFNATTRWTDVLQRRIDSLPASQQEAVVNEGISANALTSDVRTDAEVGGGPSGLDRLQRDALSQAGVGEVVLFLGTNDLWFGTTAAQLIQGYQQAIAAVHQAGLKIIGVTLLPRGSTVKEPWTPAQEAALEQVDTWIRTSGAFDGVLDLAPVVADVFNGTCQPTDLFPPFDSGDHLHPNAAGQTALADAISGPALGLPKLPTVAPLVVTHPTPGCRATVAP
jgi:lysophospholipase L1-like esterase